MFFIPGWLIALVTFPGVIVHEAAHKFFCDLAGVPVYKVSYFQVGGRPSGYVVHGRVPGLGAAFLITIGPLIVNTVLCSLITFSAVMPLFLLEESSPSPVFGALLWVGVSIGMHAIPSAQDTANFVNQVAQDRGRGVSHFFATIFHWIFVLLNGLRIIWIDAIYAVLVAFFLPWATGLLHF